MNDKIGVRRLAGTLASVSALLVRNTLAAIVATTAALAGCATAGTGASSGASSPTPAQSSASGSQIAPAWRVSTLEHVDLWLHGFAMLTSDTGHVPFFDRGYKQQMTTLKQQRNVFSQLDANRQDLSARFATNPGLTNAQFLAMYFSSFQEIVNATDLFFRAEGDPRAASDPVIQQQIAMLAANFPQPADRNWLRLFVQGLQDENTRFYHDYWNAEQQARSPALIAFREQWASRYYPKLARFLNNTQQSAGQVLLSLPIGGEGRTINDSKQANLVGVEFPRTADAVQEALFVFVHEAVGRLAQEAITDNTSPAEQRSGATAGYIGNAAVRGGAVLLQRVLPELVPGYMRFYLRVLGRSAPSGDPSAAFVAAFAIPEPILSALSRQIDVVLGGI